MNVFEQAYDFWESHGTKALGSISAFLSSVQTAALVMTPSPLSPTHMAWLAGTTAFFGAWTIKRGFYNSAQAAVLPAPDPTANRP